MGLRPGDGLTPGLSERAARLGASVPFAAAADLLAHFTGVRVGAETVRRLTEAAGAAQVAREAAAVAELERTLPDAPPGPAVQLLSVDGAMVPLRAGIWAEVKTLAVGAVAPAEGGPRTGALSYCSRCTDAATFGRLATAELHRRGTPTAGTVVAVADGAVWCQGFVDLHRPDAVRILDFPHAVEHLGAVAQAAFGAGTAAASEWLGVQAHRLRHGAELTVLETLAALGLRADLPAAARALADRTHGYLAARIAHIRYARFAAMGYPIGSGCVESANKLVVEARLKGPGMHWDRATVDPMLALRCLLANGRWDAEWAAVWTELRTRTRAAALARRSPTPRDPVVPAPPPVADQEPPPGAPAPSAPRPKTVVAGKPTADHPWKRGFNLRAKP